MTTNSATIQPTIPATAWVAETAVIRGHVTLGEDTSVWFGVVMRGDVDTVTVGDRSNIQDGAILHVSAGFPCVVGSDVTVGHGAIVHGCTVGDGAMIAMRATVLDGATIGAGALVGAGAVVPPGMMVPPNSVVLGVPAKVVGTVNDSHRTAMQHAVTSYIENKEAYRHKKY